MTSSLCYQIVSGLKMPTVCAQNNIEFALNYESKSGDQFVVTYPKSGTTWVQQIMNLIANNGLFEESDKTRYTSIMMTAYLKYSGSQVQKFPAIKTHLPFDVIPRNKGAKYLLVFRNPKDCCVSFYYLTLKTDPEFETDFHQYFKHWIKGDVPYGDYFTHVKNYWSHRFDDNFEYLVYEQMIVIGSWLQFCLIFGVIFRNYILEDMVIVIPNRVIDSWDDLKDRIEVKIRASDIDYIARYVSSSNDTMAVNFRNRLETYDKFTYDDPDFILKLIDEISSGQTAWVQSRTTLIYELIRNYVELNYSDPLFLQRLHISKYGGGSIPLLMSLVSTESWILPHYNRINYYQ